MTGLTDLDELLDLAGIDPDEQFSKWCCGIPFSINGPDTDRRGDKLCINGCCVEDFCVGCGTYTGGWGPAGCRCRSGGPNPSARLGSAYRRRVLSRRGRP